MSNSPTNRTRQGPSWSCTALDSLSSSTGLGCHGKSRHSGSFSTSTRPCRVIMYPSASSRISVGMPERRGRVRPVAEGKSCPKVCHFVFTFPLVFIIGSRKSRTREGKILHILYRRGKKERARQPSRTSFLVIEKTDKSGGIVGARREGAGLSWACIPQAPECSVFSVI